MDDYYARLGIAITASTDEIRQRYRYLAFIFHPDRIDKDRYKEQAAEDLKLLNLAYETLSDPEKRRVYDRKLRDYELEFNQEWQKQQDKKEAAWRAAREMESERFENEVRDEEVNVKPPPPEAPPTWITAIKLFIMFMLPFGTSWFFISYLRWHIVLGLFLTGLSIIGAFFLFAVLETLRLQDDDGMDVTSEE